MAPGSGLSRRRPLRNPGRGSGNSSPTRPQRDGYRTPAKEHMFVVVIVRPVQGRVKQALAGGARWGPEQRGRAPTRDAPTGGGWIPAGAGMTVSGILGFDNPRWLRGGPSSQSSPGGRRGKTSRPHPCLSPRAGCVHKVAAAFVDVGGTHPRRAPPTRLAARALSQSPPEGERFGGALPEGGGQREAGESRLAPTGGGEEARPPDPTHA